MTRYETILHLRDDFARLVACCLIPAHLPAWKMYYEDYLKEKEHCSRSPRKIFKSALVENVAARHSISGRTMFTVIAFMEGQ